MRDVVVTGNGEHWPAELPQEAGRALLLVGSPAVREIAAGDDHLRRLAVDQPGEWLRDLGALTLPGMKVGDMDDERGHNDVRL